MKGVAVPSRVWNGSVIFDNKYLGVSQVEYRYWYQTVTNL